MVEIVTETIGSRVIGWIGVNEFDLSAELLLEGVECDEVVAFDDEVFTDNPVLVPLDIHYVLFTFSRVAFPVGEDFRIEHPVDFVLGKDFVEEDLFALLRFFRLPALQDAILVGPDE